MRSYTLRQIFIKQDVINRYFYITPDHCDKQAPKALHSLEKNKQSIQNQANKINILNIVTFIVKTLRAKERKERLNIISNRKIQMGRNDPSKFDGSLLPTLNHSTFDHPDELA